MLTPYEIIIICKNEMIASVSPSDIILIQNMIFSSDSLRTTESWIPLCLPGISDSGLLQMYCNFFENNIGIAFITESQEDSYFLKFVDQSREIYEAASKENLIESVKAAIMHKEKSIKKEISESLDTDEIYDNFITKVNALNIGPQGRPRESFFSSSNNVNLDPFEEVLFLICKNKFTHQLFTFRFNNFDKVSKEEKKVMFNYCNLYDIYNSQANIVNQNSFFHFEKNEDFTHVINANDNFILFATFNFFKEFDEINNLTNEILKMIKYKEFYFYLNKY